MAKIITSSRYDILGPRDDYYAFKNKKFDEVILIKDAKYINKDTGVVTHIRNGELSKLKAE